MSFRQEFENWKEEYLSPFCLTQCQTNCCDLSRFDEVDFSQQELVKILGKEPDSFLAYQTSPMHYTFRELCPQFKEETRECQIHGQKPAACRNYPFQFRIAEAPALSYFYIQKDCEFSGDAGAMQGLRELARKFNLAFLVPD